MWPDRRLMDLLGSEYPIIQAPMAGSTTPAMAAAAANAGCIGSLGCAFMTPEAYSDAYTQTRSATNGRINMNFFCHVPPGEDAAKNAVAQERLAPLFKEFGLGAVPDVIATNFPYGAEIHAAVMASSPGIVSFHFGLPEAHFISDLKDVGTVILCSATTPAEAAARNPRTA